MIAFILYKPLYLAMLPIAAILILLYMRAAAKRNKALKLLFPGRDTQNIERPKHIRNVKISLMLTACVFIILALARPAWNLKTDTSIRKGEDIVVLLDVSRSMLAQDMKPNRLEASKDAIIELSEELKGDRIALVVFAGASQIACPLTYDYSFFENVVHNVDWQSASVGGTYISKGIERVCKDLLHNKKETPANVLLISDGGDMGKTDSLAVYFQKSKINLITVGVGNPNIKSLIPEVADKRQESAYVQYKGKTVKTSLEPASLKEIASLSKGSYVEASGKTLDLYSIYQKYKNNISIEQHKSNKTNSFKDQFQWFIAIALLLVLITISIPKKGFKQYLKLLIPLGILFFTSCSKQQNNVNKLNKSALSNIKKEAYAQAVNDYKTAYNICKDKTEKSIMAYNTANCLYQQTFHIDVQVDKEEGDELDVNDVTLQLYAESLRYYRLSLTIDSTREEALFNYELVNTAQNKLLDKIEKEKQIQKQMSNPVKEIIKILSNELALQQNLNTEVNSAFDNTPKFRKKVITKTKLKYFIHEQKQYSDTSILVLNKIWKLEHTLDSINKTLHINTEKDTIHKVPIHKMDSTLMFQKSLTVMIAEKTKSILTNKQEITVKLIQETIDYFNQEYKPNQTPQDGKQEGKKNGDPKSSDSDNENDFSDVQSKKMSSALSSMQNVTGFPPPNDNAQDVLNQEKKNNKTRNKKKARYKGSKKDW